MKNLLLWHLPQAGLFCGTLWLVYVDSIARGQQPNVGGMLIAGAVIAGVYTAAVIAVRDAPLHLRGIGRWGRRVFASLLLAIVVAAFVPSLLAIYRTGDVRSSLFGSVVVFALLGLIWATALALWHSFTVRKSNASAAPEPDVERIANSPRPSPPGSLTHLRQDR
jgi:protein-S-isoprenylcysteine O-methyltransferase Ste14